MTITLTPRRTALVLLAVLTLFGAYLIGANRSEGAVAPAGTALGGISGISSTGVSSRLSSTTQPSVAPAVGGPGIHVVGRADVAGTPDTLRLDLSVSATASSVSAALAAANRSAAAVQKSLLGNGVEKKDLQTSGLTIQPDYDQSKSGVPRITGYQVSESISAKLRNLSRAGDLIGKAVSAGGNATRINGVSLDLEETGALVSSARDKAFADAKAKAEQYAKAAGRSLGAVVTIAEDVSTPSPISQAYSGDATALSGRASVPIQPGSQDVSVSVTVVFEMR